MSEGELGEGGVGAVGGGRGGPEPGTPAARLLASLPLGVRPHSSSSSAESLSSHDGSKPVLLFPIPLQSIVGRKVSQWDLGGGRKVGG